MYYGIAHFLVTLIALVWMFRRDPRRHRLLRNTLVLTTCLAVIGFAAYSLMPPRLLDDPGRYGGCQVYAPEAAAAAEPGALVGAGLRQVRLRRHGRRVRRLDQLRQRGLRGRVQPVRRHAEHAHRLGDVDAPSCSCPCCDAAGRAGSPSPTRVLTLACIVLTANHYWIDGVGGLVCLAAGYGLARLITRPVPARRRPAAWPLARR